MRSILLSIVLASVAGCATHFTGDAKFPDGADGCRRTCESENLDMGGFVYSGEYSTSCVCTPRQSAPGAGAASTAPTAGVIVEAQAAATAAANQQMMQRQQNR